MVAGGVPTIQPVQSGEYVMPRMVAEGVPTIQPVIIKEIRVQEQILLKEKVIEDSAGVLANVRQDLESGEGIELIMKSSNQARWRLKMSNQGYLYGEFIDTPYQLGEMSFSEFTHVAESDQEVINNHVNPYPCPEFRVLVPGEGSLVNFTFTVTENTISGTVGCILLVNGLERMWHWIPSGEIGKGVLPDVCPVIASDVVSFLIFSGGGVSGTCTLSGKIEFLEA